MKKILFAVVLFASFAGIANAQPAPKVFVCKYVGKPGVDERLQTGNNPISVSSNSIKDYAGVGSFFNDAQGRSYVLALDEGQAEPNVSECPAPQGPQSPETPKVETPTVNTPVVTETPQSEAVLPEEAGIGK